MRILPPLYGYGSRMFNMAFFDLKRQSNKVDCNLEWYRGNNLVSRAWFYALETRLFYIPGWGI